MKLGNNRLREQEEAEKAMHTTWKSHEKHGDLTERSDLPDSVFAFPKQRKEPLTDASHVRNAIARFDQTIGVSDEDRELAFANIKKAARALRRRYAGEEFGRSLEAIQALAAPRRTARDRRAKPAETRKEHEHEHRK